MIYIIGSYYYCSGVKFFLESGALGDFGFDDFGFAAVFETGKFADQVGDALGTLVFFFSYVFGGIDRKRRNRLALHESTHVGIVFINIDKIIFIEDRLEFTLEVTRIIDTDPEGRDSPDVTEDGILDLFFHLADELIGDNEIEAVFAGFGENLREIGGGKILELVDIEEEITTLGLIHILARHGGYQNFGD